MQSVLRIARHSALQAQRATAVRCLATAAPHVGAANTTTTTTTASSSSRQSPISLANIEAAWDKLESAERLTLHEQLEQLQKKDWKELSLDEKKAAYFVAFGPHGPRTPTSKPGDGLKVLLGTLGLVGVAGILTFTIRHFSPPPPRTITKEWEEASNERALEMKLNPITGISSEGYSGKGYVVSK